MHDLDRTMLEAATNGEYEVGQETLGAEREQFFEVLGEIIGEGGYELEHGMPGAPAQGEAMETELALELLGVSTEQELDRFLGDLLSRAAGAVRSFARSPTGEALKGIPKPAIGQALASGALGQARPVVGRAGGQWVRPGGAQAGGQAGQAAGALLGLELEG